MWIPADAAVVAEAARALGRLGALESATRIETALAMGFADKAQADRLVVALGEFGQPSSVEVLLETFRENPQVVVQKL